jgi:hypothetical protein
VTIWATMQGMQSEQIAPQDYVSATLSSVMAGLVPAIHAFLQSHKNVERTAKQLLRYFINHHLVGDAA